MASSATLSTRQLNRAALARQMLLERAPVSALEALERLAGMQAQWSTSPYIGLWSRVRGFRISDLENALHDRDVVKATLMRGTQHLVTTRDFAAFCAATRER